MCRSDRLTGIHMASPGSFTPALRFQALSRFYDPIGMAVVRESAWKPRLAAAVAPGPGQRILDLGCGTGTLAIALKRSCPHAEVVGLDADADVLERARAKARQHAVDVDFHLGLAEEPPADAAFAAASFDTCVSSLVFHHLTPAAKTRALAQVHRLLKPGGMLHIADWGQPRTPLARLGFLATRLLDGFENTRDHAAGRLPELIANAGFQDVRETGSWPTAVGTLCFYRAERP
jgi:ubiquinone/menaquinone biosynthesis C-methylase UbiE